MTNLPALPSPQSAETRLAQLLLHASGTGSDSKPKLAIAQSTSGEWSLSASIELTADSIESALTQARSDEMFFVPSEELDIMPLVAELKAMASKPPWMDQGDAVVWEQSLRKAMTDYPIDVVKLACKRWRMIPDMGKWWPTEQDMRQQCEILFRPRKELFNRARMLLADLRQREAHAAEREEKTVFSDDRTRKFREEMRKRMTPRRHAAYFDPSEVMYGSEQIWTRSRTAYDVLTEEGGDLLNRLGVSVMYRPDAFVGVRLPSWEDDTPEEHAEVQRKFTRLKQALANGEDIKRLRREGIEL